MMKKREIIHRNIKYLSIILLSVFVLHGCFLFGGKKEMITVRMVPKETKGKKDSIAHECYEIRRFMWARNVGGSLNDATSGICVDAAGNVYVTGSFSGKADLSKEEKAVSAGQEDLFLMKYDREGVLVWSRQIGSTPKEAGASICLDSLGHVFVCGMWGGDETDSKSGIASSVTSRVYIAKFDTSNGKTMWYKSTSGGGKDAGYGICADKEGNIYVTGGFQGSISFGGHSLSSRGSSDVFIVKYNGEGKSLWAKRAGGEGLDAGTSIALDVQGNPVIAGFFQGKSSFGDIQIKSTGYCDIFTAKYTPQGETLWAKQAGSPTADDYGYGIATDLSGNVYITGMTSGESAFDFIKLRNTGNFDIFIAKYGPDGQLYWVTQAGGKTADAAYSIAATADGCLYLTGYFTDNAQFDTITVPGLGPNNENIFIAKYTQNGKVVWVFPAGGSRKDYGFSVAGGTVGNAYVTGYFTGESGFGDISLATSTRSIFVTNVREYDSCLTKVYEVDDIKIDSVVQRDTVLIDD